MLDYRAKEIVGSLVYITTATRPNLFCIGNSMPGFECNLDITCTSEFFKDLKIEVCEKLTLFYVFYFQMIQCVFKNAKHCFVNTLDFKKFQVVSISQTLYISLVGKLG
jgi:hypothetical protein